MISLNPARPGLSTVSPFLITEDPEGQLDFIKSVFGPEITEQAVTDLEGRIGLKIGNTNLLLVKSTERITGRPGTLFVYVKNIMETFHKAMNKGAKALYEPFERFNGDEECGFEDGYGNHWICARFVRLITPQEMAARYATRS